MNDLDVACYRVSTVVTLSKKLVDNPIPCSYDPFSFVVEYARLFNTLLLHFKVLMRLSGFLEMGIGLLVEAEASICARSVQDMVMRVITICGEGLISNLVYALLGVSAMSRVKGFLIIL